MSRALRYAGAALLAATAVATAQSAKAPDALRQRQTPQVKSIASEEDLLDSEANARLEEIKVELALLSDIVTFPYYLGAHASADSLQVRGFVPNELVRQRALELARHNTYLTVNDALRFQINSSARPPLRPQHQLHQMGVNLMHQIQGASAKRMWLSVRSNGVIVIAGSIDSMEGKLEVSRLFRGLSGCGAVTNELIVSPQMRNGQRVVQVTRDGSLVVPTAALGLQLNPLLASAPAPPLPTPIATAEPVPQTPLPSSSSPEAQKDEQLLPTAVAPKPAPERIGTVPYTVAEPKLPVKWTSPAANWDAQAKKLEAINVPPPSSAPPASLQQAKAATPEMAWRHPDASEESEPKTAPLPQPNDALASAAAEMRTTMTSPVPPLSRPRRWPPAYESKPPENKGRLGVITFDDDPPPSKPENKGRLGVITFDDDPPPSKPTDKATTPPATISPAKLKHQVKSICGRQARDVTVQELPDGMILVQVKVANRSVEDNLTAKILAIPEMTAPQVRLLMDVGP